MQPLILVSEDLGLMMRFWARYHHRYDCFSELEGICVVVRILNTLTVLSLKIEDCESAAQTMEQISSWAHSGKPTMT
jgi:hypothetical protein